MARSSKIKIMLAVSVAIGIIEFVLLLYSLTISDVQPQPTEPENDIVIRRFTDNKTEDKMEHATTVAMNGTMPAIVTMPAIAMATTKPLQNNIMSRVHISIKSTENVLVSRLPILEMTWLKTVTSKNVS